jgi:hypothetical protein
MVVQALERCLEALRPTVRSREERLSICKRGHLSEIVLRVVDSYQIALITNFLLLDTGREDSVKAFLAAMLCASINAIQI